MLFFIIILKHKSFSSLSCRGFGPASRLFLNSTGAPAAEALPVRSPLPPAHLPEAAKAQHQGPRGAENGVDSLKGLKLIQSNSLAYAYCNDRRIIEFVSVERDI